MKGRLIAFVGIFCIAILIFSGQDAQGEKPDKPPGKPDKPPGKPPTTEWIEFTGDLQGGQPVDGCCPNAGPYPQYTMTLTRALGEGTEYEIPAGTYDGQLFIHYFGAGRIEQYKVQFWTDIGIGFEIIGGDIDYDKKTKVLTVTFTNELCRDFWYDYVIDTVTFTLVRRPY
jgi:hypothetical protein